MNKDQIKKARKKFNKTKKLSKLVLLACDDLEAALASSKYKVNMDVWYKPQVTGVCAVCLAGAVMAFRGYVKDHLPVESVGECVLFKQNLQSKFNALEAFRIGNINKALELLEQNKVRLTNSFEQELADLLAAHDQPMTNEECNGSITAFRLTAMKLSKYGL